MWCLLHIALLIGPQGWTAMADFWAVRAEQWEPPMASIIIEGRTQPPCNTVPLTTTVYVS